MMVLGWLSHDGGLPMSIAIVGALAAGAARRLRQRRDDHLRPPARVHRDAGDVLGGARIGERDHRRSTDRRLPRLLRQPRLEPAVRLVSATVALLIVLYLAGHAFLRYRANGRALYALGGSPEVARLAGLPTRKLTIAVYTATGLLAGVAAVILAMRLDSAQPSAATGYELDTIAAVVIGGASLKGGVGTVAGTALGVLIIGVLRNGLSLMSVSPFVQQVVIGVVIALAVMLDVLRRKEA